MELYMFEPNMKIPPHIDLEIEVTQDHIKNGKKGDALKCPVAMAIKEHIREGCDALTTSKQILYYNRPFDRKDLNVVLGLGRVATISLPEEAMEKIKGYEAKGKMTPFTATYKIPLSVALTNG